MIVETLSMKGDGEWNEDALILRESEGLFGVLDGATSFVPFRGPNGETGGYLASRFVKERLEGLDERPGDAARLRDAVLAANAAMRQAMTGLGVDVGDPKELWSAGIAVALVTERRIHYAQAGDCMIAALYEDGEVRVLTHDGIDHLDRQTRRRWQHAVEEGGTTKAQRREREAPFILANKTRMNAKGGYGVLNGQPGLEDHLEYGSINRDRLTGLLLLTDGLFPLHVAPDTRADIAALTRRVGELGLEGYANELLALEQSDSECERYPRIKTSDDKSAVWIRFI